MQQVDNPPTRHPSPVTRQPRTVAVLILIVVLAAIGGYFAYDRYEVSRLAGSVRGLLAARRYDEARGLVQRWVRERPRSGEAQYYRAWLALVNQQPREAVEGLKQASQLGFDPSLLKPMAAICQARAGQIREAEPILREAFDREREPRTEVARELARIYLTTYRLTQAAEPIERWRTLAPRIPSPIWRVTRLPRGRRPSPRSRSGTIGRRWSVTPPWTRPASDWPNSSARPAASTRLSASISPTSSGSPAMPRPWWGWGAMPSATAISTALPGTSRPPSRSIPASPTPSRSSLRTTCGAGGSSRHAAASSLLTQIEPYDHEIRYSYAQALRLSGDEARARTENQRAARLRNEHDQILRLRSQILKDPNDRDSRCQVARWMLEHGHAEEGLKWTREILRVDPNHAPTHQLLADYYQKQGNAGLANYHRIRAVSHQ